MTRYAAPGTEGAIVSYQSRYDHYIGGDYVPPARGQYFENPSPVNGQPFTEIARGTAEDVERALDAAHEAAPGWGRTPVAERDNAAAPSNHVSQALLRKEDPRLLTGRGRYIDDIALPGTMWMALVRSPQVSGCTANARILSSNWDKNREKPAWRKF